MRHTGLLLLALFSIFFLIQKTTGQPIIINHLCTDLSSVPADAIENAKRDLVIAYGHTSHGSQLITGMQGLVGFGGDQYSFNSTGANGALRLRDAPFSGAADLGAPDRTAWEAATRSYLESHPEVNVIIWSWCGQVDGTESNINQYLSLMNGLEQDYTNVNFVYMTGHLNGTGAAGNVNIRNQQIRNYCLANNKILFDFADIESYDPDGQVNYMEQRANDNCDYDSDGNGSLDRNWALDWQSSHTINVDWYSCSAAHSQSLNGNQKAYAAWWLWATLAGWNGAPGLRNRGHFPDFITVYQNYPNPFNPSTNIEFSLLADSRVTLKVYNTLGKEVATLLDEERSAGMIHRVQFDAAGLSSGVYFYHIKAKDAAQVRKLLLVK